MAKPKLVQNLKGFRDFLGKDKRVRDYVASKMKEVFELYGFEPLETPTLEYADLLLGKYGDEADKLVYNFEDKGGREVALRYDQTVPTSRVMIQYQNDLPKYYRRYQIQNVFRADKPQKGRYREFTQCDIDIFGSASPLADAEILACVYTTYKNVGFRNITIMVNDRQVLLDALSSFATEKVDVFSIIQSIDKLDKMSEEDVVSELAEKGLNKDNAQSALDEIKSKSPTENLAKVISMAKDLGVPEDALKFTPVLARGLDYYTGMIYEVVDAEYKNGSIGAGGRYDRLIGQLSGNEMAATGGSFGFDRMIDAAVDLGLLPEIKSNAEVLMVCGSEGELSYGLEMVGKLRESGVNVEVYPASDDFGKQLKYADRNGFQYALIIGEQEKSKGVYTLKDMSSGQQEELTSKDLLDKLSSKD